MPEKVSARGGGTLCRHQCCMLCVLAWPGCVFSVSGPDLDGLKLGNYIAADQRAGMRQLSAPRGGVAVSRVWSLLPKNLWGYGVPHCQTKHSRDAVERRLLARAPKLGRGGA